MEIAFALLALLLLSVVMCVVAVVRGVRAAKRGIQRAGREVRRTVSDATLAARAAQPGMVGELARTRKELRACIEGTRNTLRLGTEDDPALGEALALLGRLDGHYRQLDGELSALMSGEPDRARIAARMPELRKRAEDIKRSADALRFAAQERAGRHDAEALDALHQQIGMEASALRHWDPVEGGDGSQGVQGVQGTGAAVPGPGAAAGPSGLRKPQDAARELRDAPDASGASGASGASDLLGASSDVPKGPKGEEVPEAPGAPGAGDSSRPSRLSRRFRKAEEEA
ncbi:hypothetical protein [Streptomyces johnsoniae]|uniref:Secreted protein n=1 Tax=Streptomyces johnsoniae TaxID=3075532 RepID=A0ABU2S4W6_9ACTN|nr:hypothetical protein [Streptomyces sp. DSM 41886]MDT0444012.1 hypothetical protein [Streptomyces sp. DSM 41886]